MASTLATRRVDELFNVKSGDYHAVEELDPGSIPLVSCGEGNNGVVGYFGVPPEMRYSLALTVAYNGRPLTTKYHPYEFGAKDDVAILTPRDEMDEPTLLYLGALLDREKWRYSYGRKCYREKLCKLTLQVPVIRLNGRERIHQEAIAQMLPLRVISEQLMSDALGKFIAPTKGTADAKIDRATARARTGRRTNR